MTSERKIKKIPVREITTNMTFSSMAHAGRYFGIHPQRIKKCANGTTKNHRINLRFEWIKN